MGKLNRKLDRKEKIRIINEIAQNGYNPMLFKKPKTYVFMQDLRDRNLFKMEDTYYTEQEMNNFEKEINLLNAYLIERQVFKYDELNKVLIVSFKEGKSIL
jgi:hypothetical protein